MKKKIIGLALVLIMLAGFAPTISIADTLYSGTCGDDLTWELDEYGILTISGTGEMDDYDNTAPWYDVKDDIVYVKIMNGVTSIGDQAFYKCEYLTSVTLPDDSLTSIGSHAFAYCPLESISIPESVTEIENQAFYRCEFKTAGSAGGGYDYEFEWTDEIPANALEDCYMLTEISLPDSITKIGYSAFSGCEALTYINIPDSVTAMDGYVFAKCHKLTDVMLSENLSYIPAGTFWYCYRLESIEIPDGVVSIASDAFENTILREITLPQSIMLIDGSAFNTSSYSNSMGGLESIYYKGSETQWNNVYITDEEYLSDATVYCNDDIAYSGELTDTIDWEVSNGVLRLTGTGEIPDYYPTYPIWLVYDYDTIVIDEGITSIGQYAFDELIADPSGTGYNLKFQKELVKKVYIPTSVTTIAFGALDSCPLLTDVYYYGSESKWNKIDINDENESLLNATVHYNSAAPIILPEQSFTVSGNTVTNGGDSRQTADVIIAAYDGGVLSDITVKTETFAAGETKSYATGSADRIFVWNSLEDMYPLTTD